MTKSKRTRAQRRKAKAEAEAKTKDVAAVEPAAVDPQPGPEPDLDVNLDEIVAGLDENQCVVKLQCGKDVRVSTYTEKHIADAAEEAAAAYVMGLGAFPEPTEPVVTTVATKASVFGPFTISCSLVVEARELRG